MVAQTSSRMLIIPGGFWDKVTKRIGESAAFFPLLLCDWLAHQFGLDEVTDHLVVEVLNGGPLDALLNILLLQTYFLMTLH